MMNSLKEKIEEKLAYLPNTDLYEVLDFVDALVQRQLKRQNEQSSEQPLLAIAGVLSGTPLTSEEIDRELY
ncbi:MAG: DUF2281 domain-containing protein [Cyanobacteriota bacterium]|nr:DUF2281 domain-containing protein [Cyanobacteriota bacterium]